MGVAIGIGVLWVGVILLLFRAGVISGDLSSVLVSWPLLLTYLGVLGLMSRQVFGGAILTVIGVIFLLLRIGHYFPGILPDFLANIDYYLWPIIIMTIGVLLIFFFRKNKNNFTQIDGHTSEYKSAFLSGYKSSFQGKMFEGASYKSILSGITVDLRGALVKGDQVTIDVNIILGGIELHLPSNCAVVNQTNGILGGVEDKRIPSTGLPSQDFTLVITGSILLGGLEINN